MALDVIIISEIDRKVMGQRRRASSPPPTLLSTLLAALFLVLLPLAGCGDDDDGPPEITLSPQAVTIAKGASATVTAKVDGRTAPSSVTWRSSDPAVATVVEGDGGTAQITAVNPGEARVTINYEKASASVLVTVSDAVIEAIAITPPAPSVPAGTATDLTATATLSDKTTRNVTAQVQWSTSDGAKAMITPAGRLSGLAKGAATITATLGTLKAMAEVTITDAALVSIAVTPVNLTLAKGLTRQMTATGTFSDSSTMDITSQVTWASSATANASVSAAGVVKGEGVGDAMISATRGAITGQVAVSISAAVLQSIAITPATPSVAKGLDLTLTATGTFSDLTTMDLSATAAWSSSDVNVATTNGRVVHGVNPGNATISATASGITGTTALTVTPAVVTSLQVTPATSQLAKGLTRQFTATGVLSDGSNANVTDMVTWSSSDAAIASISNAAGSRGLATAMGVGTATITATINGVTATASLEVTDAELVSIAVAPATFSLALGRTQQMTATGTFTDGTTSNLTTQVAWNSSASGIASVSNVDGSRGLVTALATGTADITANLNGIGSNTATVTVTDATLMSIAVTPATLNLPIGRTQQYTATGTYSDGSTDDLTDAVTWTSSDDTWLAISNADGSRGLATAIAAGDVTVTATQGAISGTATVSVVPVALASIAVTPATSTLLIGRTQQLTATGTFNDGSTLDLTTQVTWTSSDETRATVSNVDGSRGLVTGAGTGLATLTATMGAITGTATVDVLGLNAITLAPATFTLNLGATQQLTATATLTNGSNLDITSTAAWTSSNSAQATVSTTGLVTGVAAGTVTITATQAGVSGTATATVVAATLTITSAGDLARGTSRQLSAILDMGGGNTMDVTEQATWSSSDTAGLTVSDAAGSKGLATGVSLAGATVTATYDGMTATLAIAGCTIVINELQVAGATGSTNAAANEWIEIASKCTAAQNLTGLRLVYRAAGGTNDVNPPLLDLTGTIAAGGYNWYAASASAVQNPNPTGYFTTGTTGALSGSGGGIGLRIITGAILLDSIGYGSATNAFIEGTVFGNITGGSAAARTPDKADTNNNAVDFALDATPSPGTANN